MATPDSETNELLIRCPRCGQRFKVSPELRDRMVECGACENRFRVNDEVTLRTRKFYPGESKRDGQLDRFSRTPLSTTTPVNFETVTYSPEVTADAFAPPTVQHAIAGLLGAAIMAVSALVIVTSSGGGGVLGDISTGRRVLLAMFVSAIGSAFIIYANRRSRSRAIMISLLMSALLCGLPLVFQGPAESPADEQPAGKTADSWPAGKPPEDGAEPPAAAADDPLTRLKQEIRYGPVDQEIQAAGGRAERVTAIWLRGMREGYKYSVHDYLLRVTEAERTSHMYPRGDSEFLLVLTGMEQDIEVTAQHCRRLGRVERVLRPLRVIEVQVAGDRFVEGPIDRLSDPSNDGFYALNLKELESIDLRRVESAVERLATARPAQFRSDIVRRLTELLNEAPEGLRGKIGRALDNWSQPGDGCEQAALALALRVHAAGAEVDAGLIEFLVARKVTAIQPVLHALWQQDPDGWEPTYAQLGAILEQPMLVILQGERSAVRDSAVRILGRVGSTTAIPALEAYASANDRELRVLANRSIEQIRARSAGGNPLREENKN